ncbi:hypothetical protein AVEN_14128-1, partial [Araneus ventricosus]
MNDGSGWRAFGRHLA